MSIFRSCICRAALVIVLLGGNGIGPCWAGGRGCVCLDHLQKLTQSRIPVRMLPESRKGLIAGIQVSDRPIRSVEFIGDGQTLLVAEAGAERRNQGAAGRVLMYDLTGDQPRESGVVDMTTDEVDTLTASPTTGVWLASGSVRWDQQLKLWRYGDSGLTLVEAIPDFSKWWLRSIAFSPDEKLIATVSGDSTGPVQLWDRGKNGLQKKSVLPGPAWAASAIAFSTDGRYLAAGLGSGHHHPNDGQILVWDMETNQQAVQPSFLTGSAAAPPAVDITALSWIAERPILVAGDQLGNLQFSSMTESRLERLAMHSAHARGVHSIVPVAGHRVLSSGNDGQVILWSERGDKLQSWRFGSNAVVLAIAPSGVHFAAGTADGRVYIYKLD